MFSAHYREYLAQNSQTPSHHRGYQNKTQFPTSVPPSARRLRCRPPGCPPPPPCRLHPTHGHAPQHRTTRSAGLTARHSATRHLASRPPALWPPAQLMPLAPKCPPARLRHTACLASSWPDLSSPSSLRLCSHTKSGVDTDRSMLARAQAAPSSSKSTKSDM